MCACVCFFFCGIRRCVNGRIHVARWQTTSPQTLYINPRWHPKLLFLCISAACFVSTYVELGRLENCPLDIYLVAPFLRRRDSPPLPLKGGGGGEEENSLGVETVMLKALTSQSLSSPPPLLSLHSFAERRHKEEAKIARGKSECG